MTKTFKRIIAAAISLIVLAGVACAFALTGGCSSSAGNPLENAKNDALNTALDASGVKERIDSELRTRAGQAAELLGVPQSVADGIVDSLAVKDWQITSLPDTANETGAYAVQIEGTSAQITTYDDPSIVTVDAFGQSVTMAVPASAQAYLPYLEYLQYLEG